MGPECGNDDHLGAGGDELTESFREREIPAYEQADWAYGGVDCGVGSVGRGG
jgi:hypothetical protein